MKASRLVINLIAAPLVLLCCFGIAYLMVSSRKSPPISPKKEVAITVSYTPSDTETITPVLQSFGNTQSSYSTALSSQVGGEIIAVSPSFEAGRSVDAGDWLVKINPADYQAVLANRNAALASAKQALAQEETRSQLAKEDWLAAGRSLAGANELTLRKPQLESAKTAVVSAEAAVMQAGLDLERATLRAPFDAIVESRSASPGNVLTRGVALGSLIARERIQVRLPLSPSQASQLDLPKFGDPEHTLKAKLTTPSLPGAEWDATINRIEPLVDPRNQSVYLVGDILDPFEDPHTFLPVGAFVNASISGRTLEGVHLFPDSAVVEDAYVWIVSPDNLLAKQPLDIVFSQKGQIIARIEQPLFELPLKALTLPLASLKVGQKVIPVAIQKDS